MSIFSDGVKAKARIRPITPKPTLNNVDIMNKMYTHLIQLHVLFIGALECKTRPDSLMVLPTGRLVLSVGRVSAVVKTASPLFIAVPQDGQNLLFASNFAPQLSQKLAK